MVNLSQLLSHYGQDSFKDALRAALKALPEGELPVQKCSMRGGNIDHDSLSISVLSVSDDEQNILAKISVFFNEVSAGGSCGFDPATESGYGEMLVRIDKDSGDTEFEVVFE